MRTLLTVLLFVPVLLVTLLAQGCKPSHDLGSKKLDMIEQHYEKAHADWTARFEAAQAKMCGEQGLLERIGSKEKIAIWGERNAKILGGFQDELAKLNADEKREKEALADAIITSR